MKKIIILLAAALTAGLTVTSCKPEEQTVEPVQLGTPVPKVSSQSPKAFTVAWEAVENATSYIYTLNGGEEIGTAELSAYFSDLIPGQNIFRLKAISEDKAAYTDSEWAELTVDVSGEPSLVPESEDKVTVPAEAGSYTVNYTLTNPVEGGEVSASVEDGADWITDIDCSVDGEVTFNVAENEGLSMRSTVLTVSYDWPEAAEPLSFTLDVEQEPVLIDDVLQFIEDEAFLHYCQWRLTNPQNIETLNGSQEFPAWDTDGDGLLSSVEAASVTGIDFGEGMWDYDNMWDYEYVYDLTELEYFSGLQYLSLLNNYELTKIDLSGCPELVYLNLESASWDLYDLDLSANTKLQWVNLDLNSFETLTLGNLPELTRLQCSCYLTSIDLSGVPALEVLLLNANSLEEIDLTGLTSLKELNLYNNSLTEVDLSSCTSLTSLNLASNGFTSVDLTPCPGLTYISLRNCSDLTEVNGLSACTELTSLLIDGSGMTELDVTGLAKLSSLNCYGCHLPELDITGSGLGSSNEYGTYELYCGSQTDMDGQDMTITLTMTAAQNEHWKNSLEGKRNNDNIEVVIK